MEHALQKVDFNLLQIFDENSLQKAPKILVVDDYNFNIEAIKVLLKVCKIDLQLQVHQARDGVQAVHQVLN